MNNQHANMMNSYKKWFTTIFAILVIISCKSEKEKDIPLSKSFFKISIDNPGNDKPIKTSTFIKSVKYVPLEFAKIAIVGEVKKMKILKDMIFIQDKYNEDAILVFNTKGKFLYPIGKKGRAAGQHLELTDFDVSESNVFLYDAMLRKIQKFDLKGKLVDENDKIKFQGEYFAFKNDLFYLYRIGVKSNVRYELNVFDWKGIQVAKYFRSNKNHDAYGQRFALSGTSYSGSIPFARDLCDTIYHLNKGNLAATAVVDFEGHKMKSESRKILRQDVSKLTKMSIDENFVSGISNIHETKNVFFFSYNYKLISHSCFYLKGSKTVFNSMDVIDDISHLFFCEPLTADSSGNFVGVYYPESIQANLRYLKEHKVQSQNYQSTYQFLSKASNNLFSTNAVLVFYDLKKQ